MKYILGIDVGTTGTKAILFRQDGEQVGQAYQSYPLHTPQPGYCEQDPKDWWNALCHVVKSVTDDASIRSRIVAMALSTQGGTTVCVDAQGKPLRPAMVWNDRRCADLLRPEVDIYRTCGWYADSAMPALQCRWLQDNEPEVFRKTARFLTVPDYLSLKLTGKAVIDPSNAGICRFTDLQTGKYHPALLEFAGLQEDQLPALLPSGSPIGKLTKEAAEMLNLPEDALLVSGAHDQYAVSLGGGALSPGDILIGSGTSWVITCLTQQPAVDTGFCQSVSAVPGLWGSLRSLPSGGVCLEWLRKLIGDLSYEEINREVAQRQAATEGLFFFPFDAKTGKGGFAGLELRHDKFHLARAVMEGVAFRTAQMLAQFPVTPSREGLILAGGAAKSQVWCQILADIAGIPLRIPENPDLGCVGAAILAGTGCGLFPDVQTGYKALGVSTRTVQPQRPEAYQQAAIQYQ